MLAISRGLQLNARPDIRHLRLISTASFQDLGVSAAICQRLEQNYPNISGPTITQKALIPAILRGQDVLLRDFTGSGKSFGIVLALLSQVAQHRTVGPTHLVLVPNLDLAVQVSRWANRLSEHPDKGAHLLQGDTIGNDCQIIVTTPNLLYRNSIDLSDIRTLFVDELDRVIDPPPKHMNRKQQQVRTRHPPMGETLVDEIMKASVKPQFIGSSATLNSTTRNMVKVKGWVNNGIFLDIQPAASASTIQHHVLVIEPDNSIRNLRSENGEVGNQQDPLTPSTHLDAVANAYKLLRSHRAILFLHSTASVQATIEELKTIYQIPALGLADLDEALIGSDRPMLLVTTEHAARGLDIALGDVFIALQTEDPPKTGKPTDASSYIHMAGRVGRIGQDGRVVTFLRQIPKTKGVDEPMQALLQHVNADFRKLDIVED